MQDIYLKCDCGTHLLEISKEPGEKAVYFAIWSLSKENNNMPWKERIRWCWRILKTGNPWGDTVALGEEKVKKIVEFLKP